MLAHVSHVYTSCDTSALDRLTRTVAFRRQGGKCSPPRNTQFLLHVIGSIVNPFLLFGR